jgi:hypothetical protein
MIGKSPTLRKCFRIIPTSRNSNTLEGLESWSSVEIHRIPVELPHSTELELEKLYRTRTNSDKASMLELLGGLPTSREVLRHSEPCLSLYSTKNKLGSTMEAKLTLSAGRSRRLFIRGVKSVLCVKVGLGGLTCQAGQPSRVARRPSFMAAPTFPPRVLFLPT